MSEDIVNIIGNGQSAGYFRDDQKGIRLTCNLPPMAIDNVCFAGQKGRMAA